MEYKSSLSMPIKSKSCLSGKTYNDLENSSMRKMKLQGYTTNKSTEEPNSL